MAQFYCVSSKILRFVTLLFILIFSSPAEFRSFVGAIRADGGGDTPEDIMGALKKTFCQLSWRADSTKVL